MDFIPQPYPLYLAQADTDGQRQVRISRVVGWRSFGDQLTPICPPNLGRHPEATPVHRASEKTLYLYANTEAEAICRMERVLADHDRKEIERITREATA